MNDDDVLAGLAAQLDDIEVPDDVVDYTLMSVYDLVALRAQVHDRLYAIGGMLQPNTQEARDLHSTRTAVLLELRRRGMNHPATGLDEGDTTT